MVVVEKVAVVLAGVINVVMVGVDVVVGEKVEQSVDQGYEQLQEQVNGSSRPSLGQVLIGAGGHIMGRMPQQGGSGQSRGLFDRLNTCNDGEMLEQEKFARVRLLFDKSSSTRTGRVKKEFEIVPVN